MNVLVVGGAGYIGSHVVKALLRAGAQVTVFDNLSSGLRGNLRPGAKFRHGDILDERALDQACAEAKYDGVIHLAALKAAGESMTQPERYSLHNITGTLNLLNAISRAGIKHLVTIEKVLDKCGLLGNDRTTCLADLVLQEGISK